MNHAHPRRIDWARTFVTELVVYLGIILVVLALSVVGVQA